MILFYKMSHQNLEKSKFKCYQINGKYCLLEKIQFCLKAKI